MYINSFTKQYPRRGFISLTFISFLRLNLFFHYKELFAYPGSGILMSQW
ncbi:hypothetical protein SAMN05216436_11446 [bacterium A37T11]|nr:hypothetical protein SAMN05216436_11446 [bacterium A37T11]